MDQHQRSRWRPTRRQVLSAVGIGVALVLLIRLGYVFQWTGFGKAKVNEGVQPSKTLWDWLELLIVPVVLAVGGYLFNSSQNQADQKVAERRAQDEALQAYLDEIGKLLLDKKLRDPKAGKEARTLARARTVTAFKRLDAEHNRSILHFLRDANLVGENNIVNFSGADLEGADLAMAYLLEAPLIGTNLINTNLIGAKLDRADLSDAYLIDANLSYASLGGADLSGTYLNGANLTGTNLTGANLSGANMNSAEGITNEELEREAKSLTDTTMPDGQQYEDWLKNKDRREDGENI